MPSALRLRALGARSTSRRAPRCRRATAARRPWARPSAPCLRAGWTASGRSRSTSPARAARQRCASSLHRDSNTKCLYRSSRHLFRLHAKGLQTCAVGLLANAGTRAHVAHEDIARQLCCMAAGCGISICSREPQPPALPAAQRASEGAERGIAFWPPHAGRSAATCSIMRMNALTWGRAPCHTPDMQGSAQCSS